MTGIRGEVLQRPNRYGERAGRLLIIAFCWVLTQCGGGDDGPGSSDAVGGRTFGGRTGGTSGGSAATPGGAPSAGDAGAPSTEGGSTGVTSGGATSGGATSGGATSGGATSGGATSGGATSGGASLGDAGAAGIGGAATTGGITSEGGAGGGTDPGSAGGSGGVGGENSCPSGTTGPGCTGCRFDATYVINTTIQYEQLRTDPDHGWGACIPSSGTYSGELVATVHATGDSIELSGGGFDGTYPIHSEGTTWLTARRVSDEPCGKAIDWDDHWSDVTITIDCKAGKASLAATCGSDLTADGCYPNYVEHVTGGDRICAPGYTVSGNTCVDIDECAASPCSGAATCTNQAGSYTCSCEPPAVICDGTCTADAVNCETCDVPCSPGEQCDHGVCYGWQAVEAGNEKTCGLLASGTIRCWGTWGNSDPPPGGPFVGLSVGAGQACALRADGSAACWGANDYGQSTPPSGTFTEICAGLLHTCAIRTDGTIACWGYAARTEGSPTGTFSTVNAGFDADCAVRDTGVFVCWGGGGGYDSAPPSGTFSDVVIGYGFSCGIRTNGALACWGDRQPTPVPAGTFLKVSAGSFHVCALRSDGAIVCWGRDEWGLLSPPEGNFVAVTSGKYHSCGLRTNGTITCWGNNRNGQCTVP